MFLPLCKLALPTACGIMGCRAGVYSEGVRHLVKLVEFTFLQRIFIGNCCSDGMDGLFVVDPAGKKIIGLYHGN